MCDVFHLISRWCFRSSLRSPQSMKYPAPTGLYHTVGSPCGATRARWDVLQHGYYHYGGGVALYYHGVIIIIHCTCGSVIISHDVPTRNDLSHVTPPGVC